MGEKIIQINGKSYQVKVDRIAYLVEDNEKTPFAIVTFFDIDKSIRINEGLDHNQFTEYLDNSIPSDNFSI